MTTAQRLTAVVTISADNCDAVTGMSWDWVTRFARTHDVPIWRVARKYLIPAAPLTAAIERAAAQMSPASVAEEVARIKAEITAQIRGRS